MDPLAAVHWSPYLAGAGIGIVVYLAILLSGKPLGTGTTFTGIAGMIESLFRGRKLVSEKPYFQ
ncbi:MAG: hypothetical protein LUQ50_08685, partial [Methanospirillum sp.]|nr:hypothetical protein [Methanospirillum sp.]